MTTQIKSTSQLLALSKFYLKTLLKDWTLWLAIIGIVGALVLFVLTTTTNYFATPLPTTSGIMQALLRYDQLIVALLIIYGAELYWQEEQIQVSPIFDAYPISTRNILLGKYFATVLTGLVIVIIIFLTGITIQSLKGYFHFDLKVYAAFLGGGLLRDILFFLSISFLLQTITRQKFVGLALSLLAIFMHPLLMSIGLEHPLYFPTSIGLGTYTDLSGFGPFLPRYAWFSLYVMSIACLTFFLATKIHTRGIEINFLDRIRKLKRGNTRFKTQLLTIVFFILGSAALIFWNTNILNEYHNSRDRDRLKVAYENQLGHLRDEPQPKLTAVKLMIDLNPSEAQYMVQGSYTLKNFTDQSINKIHVQKGLTSFIMASQSDNLSSSVKVSNIQFSIPYRLDTTIDELSYTAYDLEQPLNPGDSLEMHFEVNYKRHGFKAFAINTEVLKNGSFVSMDHFPLLKYNSAFELMSSAKRKRYGLSPKLRLKERDDLEAIQEGLNGAYSISLDITIATEKDQIALSPGYLEKKWEADGKVFYHYVMNEPIENQYAFQSAKYALIEDSTLIDGEKVDLEIYHHPSHKYNTKSIMESMKASLTYFSNAFGDYQYQQARIVEFPGYQSFAVSFPNTIPFSEKIGFTMDIAPDDPDIPFWITAHEIAHQWWGEQVRAGAVKGYGLIVETLAQYSAAMVFRDRYGDEPLATIRRKERERYLKGRQNEPQQEQPLTQVEMQPYIHYGKGLTAMYALQHYISEQNVNEALKSLVSKYPGKERKYVTSDVLIDELRNVTPDSLQYLVTDLFEKIVFYENRVIKADLNTENEGYQLQLDLSAYKFESDSLGALELTELKDWIELGVYGLDDEGKEQLIYRKMHLFDQSEISLKINLNQKPSRVVIDPSYLLMDRNYDDNEWEF